MAGSKQIEQSRESAGSDVKLYLNFFEAIIILDKAHSWSNCCDDPFLLISFSDVSY